MSAPQGPTFCLSWSVHPRTPGKMFPVPNPQSTGYRTTFLLAWISLINYQFSPTVRWWCELRTANADKESPVAVLRESAAGTATGHLGWPRSRRTVALWHCGRVFPSAPRRHTSFPLSTSRDDALRDNSRPNQLTSATRRARSCFIGNQTTGRSSYEAPSSVPLR